MEYRVATTTPTQFTSDGVEIVAIQPGLAPHPHPRFAGKLVPFRYLEELLLVDDTTRFRCAQMKDDGGLCHRDDFDNPRSAVAHISSHGRVAGPLHSTDTLRTLVRLVRTYKAGRNRNYCELTAEELNKTNVPTLDGEPWNAQQVSHLFLTYRDEYRTHVRETQVAARRNGPPSSSSRSTAKDATPSAALPKTTVRRRSVVLEPAPADADGLVARGIELTRRVDGLSQAIVDLGRALTEFVQEVAAANARVASVESIDPEIVAKAEQYDQIKFLLGK